MKIFCEDTLTYGQAFFSDVADVTWFSGNQITSDMLNQADALFVRSTTKVDRKLIEHAEKLKLVATGTSGSDHLDLALLASRGIKAYSAGGCNAIAVAEYVVSGLLHLSVSQNIPLQGKKIGIVGAGHVGTALAHRIQHLGMNVLLCDPPLEQSGDSRRFVELDDILTCDVISLHVPLVKQGPWRTLHLFDEARLSQLNPQQILVNACRGEVVDNDALFKLLKAGKPFHSIFDVWENEPGIHFPLASMTDIATQHIAGHSLEGKARGTEMIYNYAAQIFGWPEKSMWDYLPEPELHSERLEACLVENQTHMQRLHALVSQVYDIHRDSKLFKSDVLSPEQFRYSRKNYAIRREFASAKVNAGNSALSKAIYGLGFGAEPPIS